MSSTLQKTVTVFGGTGFIGRHIIYALAKTGANIRVATRMPSKAYFLKPAGGAGQVTPFFCDLHDDASVRLALSGATHAIYLPGLLFESGRKGTFRKIHMEAAERVARIANELDLSLLVHVSALGASSKGKSRYSQTKGLGENMALNTFKKTVVLRPSVVFGPEDNFFNRFARMLRVTSFLPVIGGGVTKLQPVFVGDIAKAVTNILSSTEEEKYYGKVYELGGPKVYTLLELIDTMLKITKQDASGLEIPFWLAKFMGFFGNLLPVPPLTADQVRSLEQDNVVEQNSQGLQDLGVTPTSLEAVLPSYLWQYRQGGRFSEKT